MLKKWYVINTKPRSEEMVCDQLENRHLEFFFPKMAVARKKRGAKVTAIEPVFPGYVFVQIRPNASSWCKLKWTPGVKKLLDFNGVPSVVPDELVNTLRKRLEKRGFIKPKARFNRGDKVRVKDGSFWGLMGVVEEVRSGKERVKILIDMMRWFARVEIDVEELEKVQSM